MKQCPVCGADIASDLPDCGKHAEVENVPEVHDVLGNRGGDSGSDDSGECVAGETVGDA